MYNRLEEWYAWLENRAWGSIYKRRRRSIMIYATETALIQHFMQEPESMH